ncbi:hypothetical protein GQ457_09G017690 [Hibiscus cannabinus]
MKRVIKAEFESIHASLDRIDGGGFQSVHDEQKIAEDDIKFTTNSEILVVKRSLNMQPSQDDQQRENIFHTRFHVNDKVCIVIIDTGSCINVDSTLMVEKLGLTTTEHPNPYKLQWLNNSDEIKVTKQVVVPFSIGPSDEPEGQTPSLHTEAIIRELKKSFREELEPIHDRLERLEGSQTNTPEEDHAENGSDHTPNQRQNPRQGRVQQVDDNMTNIKIAIPSFQGRTDPDAYLAWESKVEHVFESSDDPEERPPSLQTQAIIRELKKSFREELEPIHDRLERLEGSQNNATEEDHAENGSDQTPNQRQNPRQGRIQQVDDNLINIKIAIPSFQGRTDPDAYLAWESKVEHIFECYNYSEQKKVRLATMEFIDYTLLWWDQLLISRRRTSEGPKLQGLRQGSRSVEDYYKEMEVAMMRANIVEDREATMARFLAGLNTEIANVVELQHYVVLEDMVHVAIKIERQQRRKSVNRGNTSSNPFSNSFSTPNNFRKPTPQAPLQIREEANSSKSKPHVADNGRGKQVAAQELSRDIQCFKCLGRGHLASECPNRRIVLLKENGEIDSDSEKEEQEPSDEDVGDDIQLAETGEVLVIKRSLNAQPMQDDQQRETIFHTRCLVSDKVCIVIIDGGSCTNVASTLMVDKLGLKTTKHPEPYKLQWLNNGGELKVTKQVVVPFSIGRYKDEVKFDFCPMNACHLLLGRPWQYDRRVLHDCFINQYSFDHEGKKVILAPM